MDLQPAQRRKIPRRRRVHRRRRDLQHRADAGDEEGRRIAVPAHHRPGQHQGARQVHRRVHAQGAVRHLPVHRAGNPGGQFQAGEEEREGRRLGPGLAGQERGQHRLLQAQALRSGDRLRRRALRFKEHFAGWPAKAFDEIEFRTVLETNTRVQGMIKGDFQGTDGYLPFDQILRLKESKNVQILEAESMRVFYFNIHNGRSLMNDVHFRRALAYAFDYDGFIKDILKGAVARNPSPNPNNLWGAPKDLKGFTYDLEKAKAELAQVKEPLRPITIGTLAGFSETEQAAALLQNGAKKIGIEIKIESAPWPVVQSRMQDRDKNYDMVPLWKSTYYVDPNNWVGELYGSRYIGTRNSTYAKDAELDQWIDEALATNDQEKRRVLYEKAATKVTEQAMGIFVYNTKWYGPYAANVGGIRFSPIGSGQDMRWAYFK
ncbi:MAG: hypothetical protein E6G95_22330 [Alphaproteobacteria bacterium]|nr:MAG: hypothetical protein E6G95_22330 [Alphaproteobacteria bacterium]